MNSKDALGTLKYIIGASNIPDSAQEKASECIKEVKKDLNILEILKNHLTNPSATMGTGKETRLEIEMKFKDLSMDEYSIIIDWLQPQRKKVGDQICIQGDDGCNGCVLGLLNCAVSYPETETLQQVFDKTVKMMGYENKNIIQAIQEELNKDAL